jgi:hypothetical protein
VPDSAIIHVQLTLWTTTSSSITDLARSRFHTCYYEHFNRRHGPMPSVGQRKLLYRQQLRWDEQGKMILNVRRIRNV